MIFKLEIGNWKLEIPAGWRAAQSLIEVVIAMGLASILLPAILTGLVASSEGKAQEAQRIEATAFLKEAQETVRVVRETGWTNISNGTYHPTISGSTWSLTNIPSGPETINGFTRKIEVSDVLRDSNIPPEEKLQLLEGHPSSQSSAVVVFSGGPSPLIA